MTAYNPSLIYGVSLGELKRSKRLNLPKRMFWTNEGGAPIDKFSVETLEQLVAKKGLIVLNCCENYVERDAPQLEDLYVGVAIRMKFTGNGHRPAFFDIQQICRLRENPSKLIKKMGAIGLRVRKTDFKLYCKLEID